MEAVRIRGLRKRFGRITALDGLDLVVPADSTTAVVGPNGAGKTTLFGIIAGFVRSYVGEVRVLERSPKDRERLRGRLSILPQDARMDRQVAIADSLVLYGRLQGLDPRRARSEADRVLGLVGLGELGRRKAGGLSHGMALRVSIAQAFVGEPELVLLDEPTAGLDPRAAAEVRDVLVALRGQATILVASHDLAEVERYCDRAVILSRGRVVQTDTMDRLTSAHAEIWIDVGPTEPPWDVIGGIDPGWKIHWAPDPRRISVHFAATDRSAEDVISSVLRVLLDAGVTIRAVGRGHGLEARFLESIDD